MIDESEYLKRNHERVDIISGKDNLDEITYEVVNKLKKRKFNNKLLKGIIITVALTATLSAGVYVGSRVGYNKGYEAASEVSDLSKDNNTYDINTAPDIVVLKYLDYAVGKDSSVKELYEDALRNYSTYESQTQTMIIKKENSEFYLKFRKEAKDISNIVPFGPFKYSIALDMDGKYIQDNTANIIIDNQNTLVYMPTNTKVDSNNLPEGSFVKNGILYVPYNDTVSIYNKGKSN